MNIYEKIKGLNRVHAIKTIKETYDKKYKIGLKGAAIIYDMYIDFNADIDRLLEDDDYYSEMFDKYTKG